jgi:hypothetical protein
VLRFVDVEVDTQQLTPPLVSAHQHFYLTEASGKETDIIREAAGGKEGTVELHTDLLSSSPAMEGFEQQVQQVRTRRAALSQSICHGPLLAVEMTVAEPLPKMGIEGTEARHQG